MRPAVLCKLEKGKVIDAQNGFVDTFNWMVDFINNLKGDADLDRSKNITLDVSKDDHPVVRLKDGAGGSGSAIPQPFDIVNGSVVRCEIPAPIEVLSCSDYTINPSGGDIFAHVDRDSNGYVLTVDQTSRANSTSHAQFLLYKKYADSNVHFDSRPRVLPVFDLT